MTGATVPFKAAADLLRTDSVPRVPFRVRLAAGAEADLPNAVTVECVEVLRWLPGRRLVVKGRIAAANCVLKLFMGAGARRYCKRERRGLLRLSQCGVPTPRLLGEVHTPDADADALGLVVQWLQDGEPVSAADGQTFVHLVGVLARMHRCGVIQTDAHLGNYLKTADGCIHALDGGGVQRWRMLPRVVALANLGLLLAQRPPVEDRNLMETCAEYARVRWQRSINDRFVSEVSRHLRRQRRHRARRYLRKTLRECSEFHCERSAGRFVVCDRNAWNEDMAAFAADPEAWFSDAQILKGGNSATVIRAHVAGRRCVIKRYNVKSIGHGLRRALRVVPRYRRSWLNGHRLLLLGVPTARPVMLLERRLRVFATVGYLVMEDLSGSSGRVRDLATVADEGTLAPELVEQVVGLFRTLADLGLVHGDTKASNFIVWRDAVHLVDLDAMGESRRAPARDVARFLENWSDAPGLLAQFRHALQAAGLGL